MVLLLLLLSSFPFSTLACIGVGRACLQNHACVWDACSGMPGEQVFWEHLTRQFADHLHLLSGGRSRDCTMNTFLRPTLVSDSEQHTISTSTHGATGAFGYGPSVGYIYNLIVYVFSKIFVLLTINKFVMFATVAINCSSHMDIYDVMNLLIFF